MNATKTNVAHSIVPRVLMDADGKPLCAAFFADNVPDKEGSIKAYIEGKGIVDVPYEVYNNTKSLNPQDAAVVAEKYRTYANIPAENLHVRQRMVFVRTKPEQRTSVFSVPSGEPVVTEKIVQAAPDEQKSVLEAMAKAEQERPVNKRSEAARKRWQREKTMTALKHVTDTAKAEVPVDVKEQAIQDLSRSIAEMLASIVKEK